MNQPTSISCHKCGAVVVPDANTLTNAVLPAPGINCMSCGELVVSVTIVTY